LATIDAQQRIHTLPPLKPSRGALAWRALARDAGMPHVPVHALPMHGLERRLHALGLDADDYAQRTGLMQIPEPSRLALAGFDRYRRPLWLGDGAGRAWNRMRAAASADGIVLDAISGYRSHAYQMGIFARKRARGLGVDEILAVNAAPGFSEHHSGDALDIGSDGEPPAEESFEHTAAFRWLSDHAGDFGFRLSYPRDNPHGIVYEPWHWRWIG
ncbi:MAG: D-alanyl-D-alanine carboxypeptidase family protein, partial [Xanthomonadales bacterium]|nr:D-alanyl-D-alanine carboxypeptidase family protein [Xanthomonadales bacterium]